MTEDESGSPDWDEAERAAERAAIEEENGDLFEGVPPGPSTLPDPGPLPDAMRPAGMPSPAVPVPPREVVEGPPPRMLARPGGMPAAPTGQAVARNTAPSHKERVQSFGETLMKTLPRFRNVIPKGIPPERLMAVAIMATDRNPQLLECTTVSVLRSIVVASQLGLDCSGIGGQGYLVPFRNNKTGQLEAQFIAGYRGLIDLARRSQDVAWIHASPVYLNEDFNYEVNPVPRVYHKPAMDDADRGPVVGFYAVAVFREAGVPPQPKVMLKKAVDRIRAMSKAKDSIPWTHHYEEMGNKTVVRALCKFLPMSPEVAHLLDMEDRAEAGVGVTLPGELVEEPTVGSTPEPPQETRWSEGSPPQRFVETETPPSEFPPLPPEEPRRGRGRPPKSGK